MNELYHYGVKGMKWGVRRKRSTATTSQNKPKRTQSKARKNVQAVVSALEKIREQNLKDINNGYGKIDWDAQRRRQNKISGRPDMPEPRTPKTRRSLNETTSGPTLVERTNKAFKDNPGLTYDKIYKEMKVDMDSEDPDVYRQAEEEWLRRYGY